MVLSAFFTLLPVFNTACFTSTHLSRCLMTFRLPFSRLIMYCLDSLMDSYCLQQSVSEVFNNQLCVQFTRRLMLHEGMSHLQCRHLQMGLPVLTATGGLGPTPLPKEKHGAKLFFAQNSAAVTRRTPPHCGTCSREVVNNNSHGS